MKFGIISDIHGIVPKNVCLTLQNVDEIWCLGDIWTPEVFEIIQGIGKPIQAVYGNWEEEQKSPLLKTLKKSLIIQREGLNILLSHKNLGYNYQYDKKDIDFHCYGHIHEFSYDTTYYRKNGKPTFLLNPGAITPLYNEDSSYVTLEIENGKIFNCLRYKSTCDYLFRDKKGFCAIIDSKPPEWLLLTLFGGRIDISVIDNKEREFQHLKKEYAPKLIKGIASGTILIFFYNSRKKILYGGTFISLKQQQAIIEGFFLEEGDESFIPYLTEDIDNILEDIYHQKYEIIDGTIEPPINSDDIPDID